MRISNNERLSEVYQVAHLVPLTISLSLSGFKSIAIGNGVDVIDGSEKLLSKDLLAVLSVLRWPFGRYDDGQERATQRALLGGVATSHGDPHEIPTPLVAWQEICGRPNWGPMQETLRRGQGAAARKIPRRRPITVPSCTSPFALLDPAFHSLQHNPHRRLIFV